MTTETQSAPPEVVDVLALSPLQEGLFSLAEVAGSDGLDLYSMQFVTEITGPVREEVLRASLEAMLERHPNLRVSLWDTGVPHPVQIVPASVVLPWRVVRVDGAEFDRLVVDERLTRFDLRRGPLLRVVLAELPDGRFRLVLTVHHVLMDGWSLALFFGELLAVYNADGSADGLGPVRPYRNYIAWLGRQDRAATLATWSSELAGVEPLLLGTGAIPDEEPARTRHALSAADTERLVGWARRSGLTLNTAVEFAWATVLGRLTDRRDVVFGTTVSGRPQGVEGVDEMVGLFINTVPARVDLDADASTILDHCRALQRASARQRDIAYLGLADISRAAGHSPLFDTLFVFENAPIGSATQPVTATDGARFLPLAMESLSHYPLTVVAYLVDGELVVITESQPDALGGVVAADVARRVLQVCRQLPDADVPDSLDVLLPEEHAVIGGSADAAAADTVPAETIVGAFTAAVERDPTATALVADDGTWTYGELRADAARLAHLLSAERAPDSAERAPDSAERAPDSAERALEPVVAVALPRSGRSVVAILAAHFAGAAYVPIDLALPENRVEFLLATTGAAVVLTTAAHAHRFEGRACLVVDDPDVVSRLAEQPDTSPSTTLRPDSAAYVIFTSGSTGEPKGVVGTHGAVTSYAADHRDRMLAPAQARLGRPLRVAHAWTFSFDASWQPLAALLDGHELHLFSDEQMRDANRLVAGLRDAQIDMIDTTPSMFAQLAAAGLVGAGSQGLSVLALGGEAIGPQLWAQLGSLETTEVHNCYGPTETTVEAAVARVADTSTPTIGRATRRMRAAILDSRLRPTPVGVVGELYLSGAQLTRGYLGRPGQTASRFVADPARPGHRMYRTGDLVRWSGEGNIEFVGRSDDQVKIRGYRIELGEVEAGLRRVPGVRTAAVLATPRPTGAALVGFVVGAEGPDLDAATVRHALGRQVPAHMVPARIVCLPALPMMSNGKLDAKALADSAVAAFADHVDGEKPATDTEHAVAAAIADMLGTAPGVTDDLFDYGLDSIVAMAVVNALRNQGHRISARDMLAHSTIRDAAAAVDRAAAIEAVVAAREYGAVDPLPVVEWMYEYGNYRRFTQTALLALPATVSDEELVSVLQAVIDGHDMLRATVVDGSVVTREPGAVDARSVLDAASGPDLAALITPAARAANDRIDPDAGAMLAATRLRSGDSTDIVLVAIHHLATDAVSWQVLFTDFFEAGIAVASGGAVEVTPEFTDYRSWCRLLTERADSADVDAQRDYWRGVVDGIDPALGSRKPDPTSDTWASLASEIALTEQTTTAEILARIDRRIGMREFLLAALTVTLTTWRTRRGDDPTGGAFIALEGHGREDHVVGSDDALVDTARTLGWFTTVFPVRLGAGDGWVDLNRLRAQPSLAVDVIDAVAQRVAAIPNTGMDFGLLKYTAADEVLRAADEPQVEFNYLGRFDLGVPGGGLDAAEGAWAPVTEMALNEHLPIDPEPDLPLRYTLDVVAVVRATAEGPQLVTNWRYGSDLLDAAQACELADLWLSVVTELVRGWGADDEAAD